jgi:hypothetical protein
MLFVYSPFFSIQTFYFNRTPLLIAETLKILITSYQIVLLEVIPTIPLLDLSHVENQRMLRFHS